MRALRAPRRGVIGGVGGAACLAAAVALSIAFIQPTSSPPKVPLQKALLTGGAGGVDTSFNRTGVVARAGSNGATGLALVPGGVPGAGDLLVSGGNGTSFQVARFTSAGALDASFGGGIINAIAGQAQAVAVAPGNGNVIAVGSRTSGCSGQYPAPVVVEYLANGGLDPFFGAGGVAALPCPTQGGVLNGVAVDPTTGNIDVAGEAFGVSNAASTLVASIKPAGITKWTTTLNVGGTLSAGHSTASQSQANAVAFSLVTGDVLTAGSSLVGASTLQTVAAFLTSTGPSTPSSTRLAG
jgi:hypothetical protein